MLKKFEVYGMTCSSCSSHVEKAVSKLSGVKKVNVNLLSNSMMVEYDENSLQIDNIINAVKDAGYSAILVNEKNKKINKPVQNNSFNDNISSMNYFEQAYLFFYFFRRLKK